MEKRECGDGGVLFKNNSKDPNDVKDRDYQGSLKIGGVEYWVSAWVRQVKKEKFLSLSVKLKNAPADKSKPLGDALSDAVPF